MKIYIILEDSDDYGGTFSGKETCVLRAFRHRDHALKEKRKMSHQKQFEESALYLVECNLED